MTCAKYVLLFFVLFNLLVSAFCRIGTKCIVLLMFFSGLIHIGWIMSAPFVGGCKYFFLYSIIAAPVFLYKSPCLPLLLLNLGGVPPLTGFMMKLRVLQIVAIPMRLLLLFFSLILIFAYTRTFLVSRVEDLNFASLAVCFIPGS